MEEPMLTRRNRESYIAVQADIVDGAQAPDVTAAISKRLEKFAAALPPGRSEEHTSELQSLMRISYAVFCLKKKNNQSNKHHTALYQDCSYTNTNNNSLTH